MGVPPMIHGRDGRVLSVSLFGKTPILQARSTRNYTLTEYSCENRLDLFNCYYLERIVSCTKNWSIA